MHVQPIASAILAGLIDRLGRPTWLGFSDDDRRLVEACCRDAAELQLSVLAAGSSPPALAALVREKAQVHAQLANIAAAGGAAVETALWQATSRLLVRAGTAILTGV